MTDNPHNNLCPFKHRYKYHYKMLGGLCYFKRTVKDDNFKNSYLDGEAK